MDHEIAFIDAFIVRAKRARFKKLLQNPKRRSKILAELYHLRNLDARFLVEIEPSSQSAESIATLLIERGAPSHCHLISTDRNLDGRDLPLLESLDEIVGFGEGTLVSCIPGRLGYFEGESPGDRYILDRSARRQDQSS